MVRRRLVRWDSASVGIELAMSALGTVRDRRRVGLIADVQSPALTAVEPMTPAFLANESLGEECRFIVHGSVFGITARSYSWTIGQSSDRLLAGADSGCSAVLHPPFEGITSNVQ